MITKTALSLRLVCLLAACGGWPFATVAAEPGLYTLDPVHTRIVFAVDHAGFSRALGTISGSTGTLRFDHDDWRSAQVEVMVPLARLDMGDRKWNAVVLAPDLLDAKRHPAARFVSSTVESLQPDRARVCGVLTLRGISRPLCMDVTLNAIKRRPLPPFRRTAGFSATTSLNRRDFGMVGWPAIIGDSVSVMIEAEAERQGLGTTHHFLK